jgi:hypothetical protein
MSTIAIGSYVTHSKLPELGAGEVLGSEKGAVRIRFASGDRNFIWDLVAAHLTTTEEAPVLKKSASPKSAKRVRKPAAPKATRAAATGQG